MNAIRLPPGQQLAAPGKWPLVGERAPRDPEQPWRLRIAGLVDPPREWTLEALRDRSLTEKRVDIHCVTRWSRLQMHFRGIPLRELLDEVGPLPAGAAYLSLVARSERNHSTSLRLDEALRLQTLIALEHDDRPIELEHGGPIRVVVPGKYFYKSLKWLERIDVLSQDRLGYWEAECGYHNGADPWLEQRYIASSISRQRLRELLAGRDLSGQNLLSLQLHSHKLDGLRCVDAVLRNADFRDCGLRGADFSRSNLTNARFTSADLREANFSNADLEGCDFSGADLRGADLSGTSLFGASFTSDETTESGDQSAGQRSAVFDARTVIDRQALEQLVPRQAQFLTQALSQALS
jgi:DMSO/TMAO reductase YedYZ molybdopterin-dependent catalytic subunit